jgi:hypothetical protein
MHLDESHFVIWTISSPTDSSTWKSSNKLLLNLQFDNPESVVFADKLVMINAIVPMPNLMYYQQSQHLLCRFNKVLHKMQDWPTLQQWC